MKHIPQQRNAIEKALSLDYSITSVPSQFSHSGDSVYRPEMIAATLPTKPLQDMSHQAAAKKGQQQKVHIQVTYRYIMNSTSYKGRHPSTFKGLCYSKSYPCLL